MTKDLNWIRDLVQAEQQMEEAGLVDIQAGFNPDQLLEKETVKLLNQLKENFVENSTAFNQLRGLSVGGIKIYGISKTQADFMLFRNGYKLIFMTKQPGLIIVRFQSQGAGFMPGTTASDKIVDQLMTEDQLEAKWGAFGEIIWTYHKQPINAEYLVRYYLSRFIKESAK